MSAQLELWRKRTAAQYIYSVWQWHYRNEYRRNFHPTAAIHKTAKELRIPVELVERIVDVQSRWNARRILRSCLP